MSEKTPSQKKAEAIREDIAQAALEAEKANPEKKKAKSS